MPHDEPSKVQQQTIGENGREECLLAGPGESTQRASRGHMEKARQGG